VQYFGGGDKGKEHLEGLSVEGKAIFQFILKNKMDLLRIF